jgi:hypothetical protein
MAEIFRITSLDFDGVLFPRPPVQAEAMAQWLFKPWTYNRPYNPGNRITKEEREKRYMKALTVEQAKELKRHAERAVSEDAINFVNGITSDIIVGNTGRPSWDRMTGETIARLDEARILGKFDRFYFKPDGKSSDGSKFWALKDMEEEFERIYGDNFAIDHYDDNARTVKRFAPLFPNINFFIVQDLTTGILFSEAERRKFPNVRRIASLRSITNSMVVASRMATARTTTSSNPLESA